MNICFETEYDLQTLTAMAKCLRKTVRKKRSRRTHAFAALVSVLALSMLAARLHRKEPFDLKSAVTLLAAAAIMAASLFEDRLNAWVGKRGMLPGMGKTITTFTEDHYTLKTDVTESQFSFSQILAIAETARYFVFALSENQAQAYEKASISGGTLADFRAFIARKTGKEIQRIK